MKKTLPIILLILVVLSGISFLLKSRPDVEENRTRRDLSEIKPPASNTDDTTSLVKEETSTTLANPASEYCEENGGVLEIITESDGSQLGLCKLAEYSCEEWSYFRNECDVEGDAALIKSALLDKGLNLDGMKVEIKTHLGKYIGGAVVPESAPAGGGYVFAVKTDDGVEVLADGNGVIFCKAFDDYPDFSTYLVASCLDEDGDIVTR